MRQRSRRLNVGDHVFCMFSNQNSSTSSDLLSKGEFFSELISSANFDVQMLNRQICTLETFLSNRSMYRRHSMTLDEESIIAQTVLFLSVSKRSRGLSSADIGLTISGILPDSKNSRKISDFEFSKILRSKSGFEIVVIAESVTKPAQNARTPHKQIHGVFIDF